LKLDRKWARMDSFEDEYEVVLSRLVKMFGIGLLISIPMMVLAVRHNNKKIDRYDWFIPLHDDELPQP
jgi:hypothetical protein